MKKPKNILVTGGSGLVGERLTALLTERGYSVSHLGRSTRRTDIPTFLWDPSRDEMDQSAVKDADAIIHLAGAGIADKRWTDQRKREILESRTMSTRLLRKTLQTVPHHVQTFVSASGISYYGLLPASAAFAEGDPPASDFMARVTVAWEKEADEVTTCGIRVVKVRTGVVLSKGGGALRKLATPVKLFAGAPLGSGKQYINWIHLDDVCRIYVRAIEDPSMSGAYNAVAPAPVTNADFTRELARVLKRPLWLPPVPGFVVRVMAGEVADVVLYGGRVSSQKLQDSGFDFQFKTLGPALEDLL